MAKDFKEIMYHHFILILSELRRTRSSRFFLEGEEIHIKEILDKKYWALSTPLLQGVKKIPLTIQQCVFASSHLRFETKGPYLNIDKESAVVKLLYEIKAPTRFLEFRNSINNFIKIKGEWKETLSLLSNQESLTTQTF